MIRRRRKRAREASSWLGWTGKTTSPASSTRSTRIPWALDGHPLNARLRRAFHTARSGLAPRGRSGP